MVGEERSSEMQLNAAVEPLPAKCKCERCGWKWTSKPRPGCPFPAVCPHCHTYLWNRPSKKTKKTKKTRKAAK